MFANRYDEIIDATFGSKTLLAMSLLDKYNLNPTNTMLRDKFKQNLLHLAARTKDHMFAEYLVGKGVSQTDKNIFGETPVDIAMKNGDSKMLGIMFGSNMTTTHQTQIKNLEDKCDDLRYKYDNVLRNNANLLYKNDDLVLNNKRLRDTNELQERDLKRLKVENENLTKDNKMLQITVNNLRDAMKK